jgi:hypothetical protein
LREKKSSVHVFFSTIVWRFWLPWRVV